MNILVVADYTAPYKGNFIESILKLEEKVRENGGRIIYSFPENAKDIDWIKEISKDREVYFHSRKLTKNISDFIKIIKNHKIDIIYSHFCILRTQIPLKIVSCLKKIKLVQHYHNHYKISGNILKRFISKYSFKGDLNIACSKTVKESIPYKKVISIDNCIDFSRLDNYEKIKIADNNQIVILMFGFDYERKGVDLAIRAIKDIAEQYNIILAISVSVRIEDVKQKIINDFGKIPSFVKFLEPRDDIATYYNASNIFISPSREEGFCYSVTEALYCKNFCIVTDFMENTYDDADDITNLISSKNEDVNDLQEKIVSAIRDKKYLNEKYAEESKQVVIKKYDINNWVEKIYSSLKMLMR